jgi:hypothetical protein
MGEYGQSSGQSGHLKIRLCERLPGLKKELVSIGWSSGENVSLGKMVVFGALIWGTYSFIYILANGIIVDQSVLPAQIMTGEVEYPAGHPHKIFYPSIFSLHNYLAAALFAVYRSPAFLSGARNILFLFLTTFVPFSVTVLLTRKPMWGHLAVLVTLSEAATRFKGNYPMFVFPVCYSDGPIGIHVAMLSVVFLLGRFWRISGFILGLLPSVHASFGVLVWPWSCCFLFLSRNRPHGDDIHRFIKGICAGAVISIVLAMIVYSSSSGEVNAEYPYSVEGNGELIRERFISFTDGHRWLFPPHSLAYLVNPIVFFMISTMLLYRTQEKKIERSALEARGHLFWMILLGGFVWLLVYGSWLVQFVKDSLPYYLEMLMPYRFSNMTALLLIPLTLSGIAYLQRGIGEEFRFVIFSAVAGLIILIGIGMVSGRMFFKWNSIFIAWGIFFALYPFYDGRRARSVFVSLGGALIVGVVMLSFLRETKAGILFLMSLIIVSAGLVVMRRVAEHFSLQKWNHWVRATIFLLWLSTLVVSNYGLTFWDRVNGVYDGAGNFLGRWDQINEHDRDLKEWLIENAEPSEMILPPVEPCHELQAKTSYPMLFGERTLWSMTYMPELAPVIGSMMYDIYGIDYTDLDQLIEIRDGDGKHLSEAWSKRSLGEWRELKNKYNFRLVLCPNATCVSLPVEYKGPIWTIYSSP